MLSGIYELDVTGTVIMDMLEKAFNTNCWMENNIRFELNKTQVMYSTFQG